MKNNSVSTCAGAMTLLAALMASGCASAPIVAPVAPTTSFEQKMAWMLQLEDRRILLIQYDQRLPRPLPWSSAGARGRRPRLHPSSRRI